MISIQPFLISSRLSLPAFPHSISIFCFPDFCFPFSVLSVSSCDACFLEQYGQIESRLEKDGLQLQRPNIAARGSQILMARLTLYRLPKLFNRVRRPFGQKLIPATPPGAVTR